MEKLNLADLLALKIYLQSNTNDIMLSEHLQMKDAVDYEIFKRINRLYLQIPLK